MLLNLKSYGMVMSLMMRDWKALETMAEFRAQSNLVEDGKFVGCLVVQPTLVSRILAAQ